MDFAKDTWITMADGSSRQIADIRAGDRIMSDGPLLRVVDVWRGSERNLMKIVVEGGAYIQLMPDADVMTPQCAKRASRLFCGDLLQCKNGNCAVVRSIEITEYQDVVYQLVFEQNDGVFYANDFVMRFIQPG